MNKANDKRTHLPDKIRQRIAHYAGLPQPEAVAPGRRGVIVKELNLLCHNATTRRLMLRYLTGGESDGTITEMSAMELTGQEINGIWQWLGAHVPDRDTNDPQYGIWLTRFGVPTEILWLLNEIEKLRDLTPPKETILAVPEPDNYVHHPGAKSPPPEGGMAQQAMKLGGILHCGRCGCLVNDGGICSNEYCMETNNISDPLWNEAEATK